MLTEGTSALKQPDKENGAWTYADYKDWALAPGERFEVIHGFAYAMSAPNERHQLVLGELCRQIANYLVGKNCKVFPAPYDVRLFYKENGSDDTVVQPDIAVLCGNEKRGAEGCRGAPDFIAEILSPSNTAIEMERKFSLYREAGVREYWVLDPENNILRTYQFKDGAVLSGLYTARETAAPAIFDDLTVDLESVFA